MRFVLESVGETASRPGQPSRRAAVHMHAPRSGFRSQSQGATGWVMPRSSSPATGLPRRGAGHQGCGVRKPITMTPRHQKLPATRKLLTDGSSTDIPIQVADVPRCPPHQKPTDEHRMSISTIHTQGKRFRYSSQTPPSAPPPRQGDGGVGIGATVQGGPGGRPDSQGPVRRCREIAFLLGQVLPAGSALNPAMSSTRKRRCLATGRRVLGHDLPAADISEHHPKNVF
jgi:hypothetical protein